MLTINKQTKKAKVFFKNTFKYLKINLKFSLMFKKSIVYLLLVGLRTNIFKNMGNTKLELISNWGDPGVVLCFEDLLLTS